jgi:hypothetical protein
MSGLGLAFPADRLRRDLITADHRHIHTKHLQTQHVHHSLPEHHSSHLHANLSCVQDINAGSLQINAHLEQSPRPPPHPLWRTFDQCMRQTTHRPVIFEHFLILDIAHPLRIDRVERKCG